MPPARRGRARGLALVTDYSEATLRQFLQQLARQKNKRVDGVSELTRQQLHNLCVSLNGVVQAALRVGPPYWDLPAEDAEDEDVVRSKVQDAARTLQAAAALVVELLTERGNEPPPEQLRVIAQQLHEVLLEYTLAEPLWDEEMMDAVARMCCTWWERKAPCREDLVARAIPYVLCRAANGLNEKGKTSWVHTVYSMRDALELLDFEDANIHDTKRMLLVVARDPAFIKAAEGRRFIAFLFKLHPSLTQEVAAIVRNQIASGHRSVLEAYGEIFFRAWRDTVGPCAAEVENELQRLMQAAILASTPRLAASLRIVLNSLHSHKPVEKRVAPLMVRLYDPILPRAFGAANAEVRRNAVNLLAAAFPIMDPEAPAVENNTRMTQQMSLLMESLADSCPVVREAAAAGCCHVLDRYWELIPAATSAKIMSDITTKLAYDGASKGVRVAVLRGLRQLVDNQNAQPVLKKALTGVTALLHDAEPVVREALMDLVLAVTNCRDFKFWELIAPEALLEAVAADGDEGVARKIVRLLLPSYFPNADSGATYMAALLRANPGAAQALCRQLVSRYLPAPSSPHDSASQPADYGISVPLEQLVQVASTLASHLTATAGSLQTPEEAAGAASPPAKRPKATSNKRGKKGAAGSSAAVAGKKRAKKKEAQPEPEEEEADADEQHGESGGGSAASRGAAVADQAADDDDDVVLVQERETADSWVNILGGLALLVEGLGAAVTARGVDGNEVAAVFDDAGLEELLRAAEEDVRKPEAMRLVLRMTASVHFLPAAARARTLLYRRMTNGCVPGLGSVPAEVLDVAASDLGAAAHWDDPELLAEALKTLATGHHAPKLFAMLAGALGAREPQPLRRPRNADKAKDKAKAAAGGSGQDGLMAELLGLDSAGHEADTDCCEHDVACVSCKRAEPADTMLLCDGCDLGCHIACMRPALPAVPAGDWLCWHCEAQVQGTALPPAAAGRCVALLLQMDEPRQLLCNHELFPRIIEQLKEQANQEADELYSLVYAATNGGAGTDEANSAPADSAAAAAAATAAAVRGALLGDPWGAMTRYCRASLHRSMWAAMPQPLEPAEGEEDGDEEEEEEEAPKPKKQKKEKKEKKVKKLADAYFADENDEDKFLKEYILNKGWVDREEGYVPSYREIVGEQDEDDGGEDGGDGIDDEEDERYLRSVDAFEAKYNFRYEEPGADRIITHPRNVEGTVRKEDDRRKRQRDAKKARQEAAEAEAREEVKRMKNLKKQEIESKLDKLRNVAGVAAPAATSLDDVLEGDFDPEEWDKKMAAAFNDDYYDAEEELEGLADDLDLLAGDSDEELGIAGAGLSSEGEKDDVEEEDGGEEDGEEGGKKKKPIKFADIRKKIKEVDALSEDPDDDEGDGKQAGGQKKKRADPAELARQRNELQRLLEDYYKLDYEDNVAGIKTRFRYKPVDPSTFGLSVDDILRLDDKSLNQVVGIKRLAPYREDATKLRPNYKALQMVTADAANAKQKRREYKKRDWEKGRDGRGGGKGGNWWQGKDVRDSGNGAGAGPGSAAANGSGEPERKQSDGEGKVTDAKHADQQQQQQQERKRKEREAGPGPGSRGDAAGGDGAGQKRQREDGGAGRGHGHGQGHGQGKGHFKPREWKPKQVDPQQARLASYAVPTLKKDNAGAAGPGGYKRKRDDADGGKHKQQQQQQPKSDGPQLSRAQKKNLKRTQKRAEKKATPGEPKAGEA